MRRPEEILLTAKQAKHAKIAKFFRRYFLGSGILRISVYSVLDEAEKKKMMAAHSDLLRKFTELGFDESAEARWQESRATEADNIDVGPATETDLQSDLIEVSGNPF